MKFEKIRNKGQAQLFQNQYLELLTKTHPLVIWSLYLPVAVSFPYYGITQGSLTLISVVAYFVLGMFFWSLFEYVMHRFVFHRVAESERAQRFIYIIHGNHHEFPRDRERLFMPPVPSLILSSFIFLMLYIFLQNAAFPFFGGFLLGYLIYGTMHYAIHAWNPPFKWMKPLWRNHHLHHYKNEEKGFGVSSTLWDWIFGTMFDLNKEKEEQDKVQELMFK